MKTLIEMFESVVATHPGRVAVVEGGKAFSYSDLKEAIVALATRLSELGIRPRDPVGILLPNSSDFLISYFAIVLIGGIVVPLNEQYQETELTRFLKDTDASLIITSRAFGNVCHRALPSDRHSCRVYFVDEYPQQAAGTFDCFKADPGFPVMYQFSSGSTGSPKRIIRTHGNLVCELDSLSATLSLTHTDRFLGLTPFSHVNGLMRSMMASVRAGATLFPVAKFERGAVAQLIQEQRISVFIGVPFVFGVMAKTNYDFSCDLSSLRLCISASAPMPSKLNRLFHDKFGLYVRQLYGSTETGTISVNLHEHVEESLESVGTPVKGVEVQIIVDEAVSNKFGTTGEVAVKSAAAISRYDGRDDLNGRSFRDGYFLTGDLGRQDQDGLLYLVGRKKFFINKGGYKVNPREIEEILEAHEKVEEAVVIGCPTVYGDEKLKAIVVASGSVTEEELVEHCRGKIASFKIPGFIEFMTELPKTATGKVRRALLS